MNKKQLIVAWVVGVLISIVFIANKWYVGWLKGLYVKMAFEIIPILIIGGLLIYTLRDKKK